MGLGKSLKKLAGSGLSPLGSLMYKKDGSTREGFKDAAKVLSPAYALLGKSSGGAKSGSAEPQEGGQTGRPTPGRGMLGRVAAQAAEKGGMPMSGGGKKNITIPRSGEGMKAGGYVKAADGCAKKGKTKGRML
jgi:hypothetical protein